MFSSWKAKQIIQRHACSDSADKETLPRQISLDPGFLLDFPRRREKFVRKKSHLGSIGFPPPCLCSRLLSGRDPGLCQHPLRQGHLSPATCHFSNLWHPTFQIYQIICPTLLVNSISSGHIFQLARYSSNGYNGYLAKMISFQFSIWFWCYMSNGQVFPDLKVWILGDRGFSLAAVDDRPPPYQNLSPTRKNLILPKIANPMDTFLVVFQKEHPTKGSKLIPSKMIITEGHIQFVTKDFIRMIKRLKTKNILNLYQASCSNKNLSK